MSRIKAAIVAAVLATTALLVPAAPAHADDWGNNNWTCDYYEICFDLLPASNWDIDWGIGHAFYWGNMHHDQEVMCDTTGWQECLFMMDVVDGVWNRDSTCDVKLWDVDGYGNWYVYYDVPRGWRGDYGQSRNNGHSRC